MNKVEQKRVMVGLEDYLSQAEYQLKWFRQDTENQFFEFLVLNKSNYGIIYGTLSINEDNDRFIRVFDAKVLSTIHNFIDVIDLIEKYDERF